MSSHVILSGSHREHPAGAAFLGKPSPDEILHISCILRRKGEAPDPPVGRVSHQQFERMHGAIRLTLRLSSASPTNTALAWFESIQPLGLSHSRENIRS